MKRALSKQTNEYNKILAKKDEQIEKLNERIRQLAQVNGKINEERIKINVFFFSQIILKQHYDKQILKNYILKNAFCHRRHH